MFLADIKCVININYCCRTPTVYMLCTCLPRHGACGFHTTWDRVPWHILSHGGHLPATLIVMVASCRRHPWGCLFSSPFSNNCLALAHPSCECKSSCASTVILFLRQSWLTQGLDLGPRKLSLLLSLSYSSKIDNSGNIRVAMLPSTWTWEAKRIWSREGKEKRKKRKKNKRKKEKDICSGCIGRWGNMSWRMNPKHYLAPFIPEIQPCS